MSLADESSLLFIPTGYKEAKIYSVFPTTGVGDFTFNRNSSATRIAKNGLITSVAYDIPRLEYPLIDGVVNGCPSLLLEPSRTNLVTYSEAISNSSIKSGTFVDNFAISPDGTQNATKITSIDTDPYFYQSISVGSGDYTISVYVKGIGSTIGKEFLSVLGSGVNSPSQTITGEWKRFTFSSALIAGTANRGFEIPNPSVAGDELLVWGWQLEEGSYPTSYIPTNGTTVTRAAETANGAGDASTFNDSEGVLMAEISFPASITSSNLRIAISDTTANNRVLIQNISAAENRLQFYVIVGGVTSTDVNIDINDITTLNKIVFKYKENDFSVWINGFEVLTDTSGITFPNGTLTELAFDGGDGGFDFYGNTKQIQYFDSALNDSDLEELTSWDSFGAMAIGQLYTIK